MIKKILLPLLLILFIPLCFAEWRMNPYTRKMDFYWGNTTLDPLYYNQTLANSTFLKLDASNDPVTGELAISGNVTLNNTEILMSSDKGIKINESIAGKAIQFNGSSTTITSSDNAALDVSTNCTIEAYVKCPDASPTLYNMIYKRAGGAPYLSLYGNNLNSMGLYFYDGTAEFYSSAFTLTVDTWYHFAVSFDNSLGSNNIKFFKDGTLVSQHNSTNTIPPRADGISMGVHGGNYADAIIDEFRLSNNTRYTGNFTRPTSPFTNDANTVVLYHLDTGSGTNIVDSSSNSITGTLANGSWVTGFISGGTADKYWIKRTSGSPVTNAGTVIVGYTGDTTNVDTLSLKAGSITDSTGAIDFGNENLSTSGNLLLSAGKLNLRDTAIGIYSQADTYMDLFADGGVRIGNSSAGAPTSYSLFKPNGYLVLPAGTATAGTAPLKFTAGTLLGTPEPGAMNYVNDKFYVTCVGTQRVISRTSDVKLSTTTVTNTTDETTVFTASVPANSLKAGNVLEMNMSGDITTASVADIVTINIKVGGVTMATIDSPASALSSKCWHVHGFATLRSVGGSGSMAWHLDMDIAGTSADACGISTVDTTASSDITVTAQWNNAKVGNIFNGVQGFMDYKN